MKHYTDSEIQAIRESITSGTVFCGIESNRGIGTIRADKNLLFWNHFGSSANKNTNDDLRWIVETIFSNCSEIVPCEYSDYHMNYIPIDSRYTPVDMSAQHPNVYGL